MSLQKQIEAARVELLRQAEHGEHPAPYVDLEGGPRDVVLDGHFDLEALVRAVAGPAV